jgi:anti-sigma B factor antagonist
MRLLEATLRENVIVVALNGEHDVATADEVRAAGERAVSEAHPCVFDLRSTEFIDSTIVAVLLGTQRRCREAGVGFATAVSDDETNAVRRIVEQTGVGSALSVATEIDAAIETARSPGAASAG